MDQKLAVAYLNAVKSSPMKVSRVSRNIVGLPVSKALKLLQFSNLKISSTIKALVYSAMANAENNHGMDVDSLHVKDIEVGRSFALRRFSARGRGRSNRIIKTFSRIRVILAEKQGENSLVKQSKE